MNLFATDLMIRCRMKRDIEKARELYDIDGRIDRQGAIVIVQNIKKKKDEI
jgi:hypothetical protein